VPHRWLVPVLVLLAFVSMAVAQAVPGMNNPAPAPSPGGGGATAGKPSDLELVERLITARRDYQKTLELLRGHYLQVGDMERSKWAEEELRQFHRIPKHAFRLELDVPPPNLQATANIPDANKLFTRAMTYKDKGWGTEYLDNQRRAEILFQELLTKYPQSDKISDAAYMLGDVYESKAYRQYRRSAHYFERCFQWNPKTSFDARLRAARIYDRQLQERGHAIDLYREITTHETDPKRIQEANKRLTELSAQR
jgi:TolA-binding protein